MLAPMSRTPWIASGVLALAGGALGFLQTQRRRSDAHREKLWTTLLHTPSQGRFEPAEVEGLPKPAQRYLRWAIAPGTKLAGSVELTMKGRMRLSPTKPWMPMMARQVLAPPHGFVWRATIGSGLMTMHGGDLFAADPRQVGVEFWLANAIPLVRRTSPDANLEKAAAGRMVIESMFLPASLLPSRGATWTQKSEDAAEVALDVDGESMSFTLEVGEDDALRRVTMKRWDQRTPDGSWGGVPFGGDVLETMEVDGYRIPKRVVVWWHPEAWEERFEFFEAEIESAHPYT